MVTLGCLLFILAIVGAWYLGYCTHHARTFTKRRLDLPRDYLVGLNFLLNEEPDKAVDVFIKMLAVDSNTVETHLAVGKLFRRRGEVDRAIRIHQNLIARPQLDKNYRVQALFALGQDYFSAGFLDRAERIFLEVLSVKEYAVGALRSLLDIYQQEKEWLKAIKIANKIEAMTKGNMQPVVAQYYCELAKQLFTKDQIEEGNRYLKLAYAADPQCVRASLLQAEILMQNKDHKSALFSLQKIKDQNPAYISESVAALAMCYQALRQEEELIIYLQQLLDEYPHVSIAQVLTEQIQSFKGEKEAMKFITEYVRRYPSMQGLHMFINLCIVNMKDKIQEDLTILKNLIAKLLADKPDYQCYSCGFSGKFLHWLCPGCKQWATTRPLLSIESNSV